MELAWSAAPAVPSGAGKYWWLPVAAGVLSFVIGVVALVYPGPTLVAVGFLFGIYLAIWGVITLVDSVAASGMPVIVRVLAAVLSLITLLAGLLLMVRPGESVLTAALVLGFWWIMSGVLQVARGVAVADGRVANVLWGLLGIAAGTVILVQPEIGLGALVLIVGIGLIVQGVLEVVAGFGLRRLHEAGLA